jgi:putative FmdB family regulatory protein
MATYEYRCDVDGPVDITLPIGTAPAAVACPSCGDTAARVFTAPLLGLADRRRTAVIDHAESSRFEPPVVSSIPATSRAGRRRRVPAPQPDPRTSTLPRP